MRVSVANNNCDNNRLRKSQELLLKYILALANINFLIIWQYHCLGNTSQKIPHQPATIIAIPEHVDNPQAYFPCKANEINFLPQNLTFLIRYGYSLPVSIFHKNTFCITINLHPPLNRFIMTISALVSVIIKKKIKSKLWTFLLFQLTPRWRRRGIFSSTRLNSPLVTVGTLNYKLMRVLHHLWKLFTNTLHRRSASNLVNVINSLRISMHLWEIRNCKIVQKAHNMEKYIKFSK